MEKKKSELLGLTLIMRLSVWYIRFIQHKKNTCTSIDLCWCKGNSED